MQYASQYQRWPINIKPNNIRGQYSVDVVDLPEKCGKEKEHGTVCLEYKSLVFVYYHDGGNSWRTKPIEDRTCSLGENLRGKLTGRICTIEAPRNDARSFDGKKIAPDTMKA